MDRRIERRLRAAESRAKRKKKRDDPRVIRVEGGLPGPVRCARSNGLHWERVSEEAMEDFEKRVFAAAKAAGAKNLVIGGLCGCHWKEPGSFEAYLNGLDFSDVPPEEPH
jgi:hypothetical protein